MIRVHLRKKPDRQHYQLYFVDPLTGMERTKSAKTDSLKDARIAAGQWQAELRQNGSPGQKTSWELLVMQFKDQHLIHNEEHSGAPIRTAIKHFERIIGKPQDVRLINANTMSRFVAGLSAKFESKQTVVSYARHIRTLLRWAVGVEILDKAPKVTLPRVSGGTRGRSITDDELAKMIAAAGKHRECPNPRKLQRFIEGLFHSGLRGSEAIRLHWERGSVLVDLDGSKYPRIVFTGKGQKSRRNEIMPITPEFAAFLKKTPPAKRKGLVFGLSKKALQWVAECGRKSLIVVNDQGKFASAHDLRRTFGTRWSFRVRPIILQRIMRHSDIKTTLKYYIDQQADDVGRELWESVLPAVPKTESLGDSPKKKIDKKPGKTKVVENSSNHIL